MPPCRARIGVRPCGARSGRRPRLRSTHYGRHAARWQQQSVATCNGYAVVAAYELCIVPVVVCGRVVGIVGLWICYVAVQDFLQQCYQLHLLALAVGVPRPGQRQWLKMRSLAYARRTCASRAQAIRGASCLPLHSCHGRSPSPADRLIEVIEIIVLLFASSVRIISLFTNRLVKYCFVDCQIVVVFFCFEQICHR